MNTIRIAATVAVVATATLVAVTACTGSRTPTAASEAAAPLAVATGRAALRAAHDGAAARIPARFLWVGEEHNRVMLEGITEYRHAQRHDPALERRMREDCDWTLAVVDRELARSVARQQMEEGEGRALMGRIRPALRDSRFCRPTGVLLRAAPRLTPLALFMRPFEGMPQDESPLSTSAQSAFDQFVTQLAAVTDAASAYAAIDQATISAASLTGVEQDFLYGAASLALASTALWSEQTAAGGTLVDQAPAAMSLFRGPMAADAKTLRSFLWADAVGCISTGTLVLKYVKDVRPVLAGCFGGGAVASLRYFVS